MGQLLWFHNLSVIFVIAWKCVNRRNMTSRPSLKRSRQLSLFESFQNSKSPKRPNTMDNQSKAVMRECLASAAEKRIKSQDSKILSENIVKDEKKLNTSLNSDNVFTINSCSSTSKNNSSSDSTNLHMNINKISSSTVSKDDKAVDLKSSDINKECGKDKMLSQSTNSDDLFNDSFPDSLPDDFSFSQSSNKENTPSPKETLPKVSDLNRLPACAVPLPQLAADRNHTILFRPHLRDGSAPRPYPDEYRDIWDNDHVRMPCSPSSQYPVTFPDGQKVIQSRWDLISDSLTQSMVSSSDLERVILQYNRQYASKWNFLGLHHFCNKSLKQAQKIFFFNKILPSMVELALKLPEIVTQPIPLLRKHTDHAITLSQKQISCLLANAFFCTFPRRNSPGRGARDREARRNFEYALFPCINFNRLFYGTKNGIPRRNAEKLKCLINYFVRVTEKTPTGTLTFHRKYIDIFPSWASSVAALEKVVIASDGLIESEGSGMLQVDFANRYVGGGVIGQGCVQEEIRFIICPELIVSMLFTEKLTDSEALIVTGVEQYNDYTGYGDSFEWNGNYEDNTPRDTWGRKYTQVVAIDATPFRNSDDQYKLTLIKRELNKAYVGFLDSSVSYQNLPAIATGNWGCGAYKGNPNLKFLIQLMAASQAGRGMLYFTFGDKKLKESLEKIYKFVKEKQLNVGLLWSTVSDYFYEAMELHKNYRPKLYDYIYGIHSSKKEIKPDTEEDTKTESLPDDQIVIDETPDSEIQEYSTETEEEN